MRKLIFVLTCLFFVCSLGMAKEKIEFESVLSSAQYLPVMEKEYRSIWILKFENGSVVPLVQDSLEKTRETIWLIGKKYRVGQKMGKTAYNFIAELIELTGIAKIDEDVKKRLEKQKKK